MLLAPEKFAPEEILTILQTGIVACKVATRLCEIISNQLEPPKFTTRAKVGTFFARDNAANFLTWCKLIGVSNTEHGNIDVGDFMKVTDLDVDDMFDESLCWRLFSLYC